MLSERIIKIKKRVAAIRDSRGISIALSRRRQRVETLRLSSRGEEKENVEEKLEVVEVETKERIARRT